MKVSAEIKEKVLRITELCIDVTSEGEFDCSCWYHGSSAGANGIDVYARKGTAEVFDVYMFFDNDGIIEELDSTISKLEGMINE